MTSADEGEYRDGVVVRTYRTSQQHGGKTFYDMTDDDLYAMMARTGVRRLTLGDRNGRGSREFNLKQE